MEANGLGLVNEMKSGKGEIESAESPESRDARLLLGAAKVMIRGVFVFLGVIGAIAAAIVVHLSSPAEIEEASLWVMIPVGVCIVVYFSFEIRWWWIKEYRDAPQDVKSDEEYVDRK
jgi:hypothetical protein